MNEKKNYDVNLNAYPFSLLFFNVEITEEDKGIFV